MLFKSVGEVFTWGGRKTEAAALARRLLELLEKRGHKNFIARALLLQASCDPAVDQEAVLKRGLAIAEEIGSRALAMEFHDALLDLRAVTS